MSLKDKAVSSVFWTAMQQFGSQGITFVVSIVLARLLEPKDFGIIALFGVISGLAVLLMSSGMTTSLLRSKDIDDEDLSTVFLFNIVVAFVLYIIIYLIAPWIEWFYKIDGLAKIVRVYSVIFVIQAFGAVQKMLITKVLDFKKLFIIQLPSLVISSVCGVVMAYNGFGIWALVYMGVIQYFLDTTQIWLKSSYRPKWVFSKDKFRRHFGFGINMTFTSILNVLFQNLYVIYIGKVFSPAILGLYNRAESLKNLPVNNIMNILKRVLVPFFSTIEDDRVLKSYYKKIMSSVIFILSPILVVLIFQAENIVRILLTEKWIEVVPYLQIICLSGFLHPLSEYNINVLVVKGKSNLVLKLEFYKKIITIVVFSVSLIWGIYGLLVGQVINSVIIYIVNSYYTKDMICYSNREQLRDIFPYIGASFMSALVPFFLFGKYGLNIENNYVQLICFGVLFLCIYILSNALLKLDAYNNLLSTYKSRRR